MCLGRGLQYNGHFDVDSNTLTLKHQDTLAEGGATHSIQGVLSCDRPAKFELRYSQWWADISKIQGGVGGRQVCDSPIHPPWLLHGD